jgi:Uri superfamily endonuclease
VAAVTAPVVRRTPGGPYETGGTYVVVLQVDAPGVVRLGDLGTFWFPAGHLLYVGSAFQAGGVAGRTDRHLDGSGPRLWQVDYLRGFARRTELWWTHHEAKVECDWALALAGTPQCCCTAPLAGASDCRRCPAHLYSTTESPSVEAFARRLGRSGAGGYTIHCQSASQALGGANREKLRLSRKGETDPFNPLG